MTSSDLTRRVAALDWTTLAAALDADGYAVTPPLLDSAACAVLASGYGESALFRARIVMARHGFGSGEYQYYAAPLPRQVAMLREALFPPLARVANRWAERLGAAERYPADLAGFLARCHAAGQTRPTPLLLKYGPGDYNCLHRDLYGDLAFPLQATILLSAPGGAFAGGEFLLVEQRPRMQSRGTVVPLMQGQAVIFPVNVRPVAGSRGDYRVAVRHGVSPIRSGQRFTLGLIFHDAR